MSQPKPRLPHLKSFRNLPDELFVESGEICWENFDSQGDEQGAFTCLAEELLLRHRKQFKLANIFDSTAVEQLHGMCITILNTFYPLTEVKQLLTNPDYTPQPYRQMEPEFHLIVAVARSMLEQTRMNDHLLRLSKRTSKKGLSTAQEISIQATLGHTGIVGINKIRSNRSGGKNGGVQTPEDVSAKKSLIINEYKALVANKPTITVREAAKRIAENTKLWEKTKSPLGFAAIRYHISRYTRSFKIG